MWRVWREDKWWVLGAGNVLVLKPKADTCAIILLFKANVQFIYFGMYCFTRKSFSKRYKVMQYVLSSSKTMHGISATSV
jgi:hypothetical protein